MTNKAKSLQKSKQGETNVWEERREWVQEVKAAEREQLKKVSKKVKRETKKPLLLKYF